MDSFFEEIIPPSAVAGMRQLGDNMDLFQNSMKQILGFQNMLYQGLKALTGKYSSLKNEVNFLNNQLLNIDDSVQNYLARNPIQVYTKDGMLVDDALGDIQDKMQSIFARLAKAENNDEKFKNFMDLSVSHDEIIELKEKISQNSTLLNTQSGTIMKLQETIVSQEDKLNDKWNSIKEIINSQNSVNEAKIDKKCEKEDLQYYLSNGQTAELIQLFKSIPLNKQVKIIDIIPQVFSDTQLINEEKIKKCYEMLNIEKNRVAREQAECKMEFGALKKLALSFSSADEDLGPDAFEQTEVRSVGCDSGVVDIGDVITTMLLRKCKHRTVGCDFKGPLNVISEHEPDQEELISKIDTVNDEIVGGGASDVQSFAAKVIAMAQDKMEEKISDVLNSIGHTLNKSDIVTIMKSLKDVDKMKDDIASLKLSMVHKVDKGIVLQEHEQFVRREEFFQFIETGNSKPRPFMSSSREREPLVRTRAVKTVMTPRKKVETKGPLPLVPSRNSKMMGVNDKYAIGDDGKMYFKEFGDSTGLVTSSRSTKPSYYQRSKTSMEQNGIDTVLDFQPFVPLKSTEKMEIDTEKN